MDRNRFDQLVKRYGALLLTGLFVAGVGFLVWVADEAAKSSPRFFVRPDKVSVLARPSWLGEATAQAIAGDLSAGLPGPVSIRDSAALGAWRTRLDRLSPWVSVVLSLSPRFPGRAEAELQLRRPVLLLPNGEWVAADGSVLGHGEVHLDPPALVMGGAMGLDEIAECAAAAAEVAPWRAELTAQEIDLISVRLSQEQRVLFETASGVDIEWGRSALKSDFSAVDLPVAARVSGLLEMAEARPGLIGVDRVVLWLDRPELRLTP
ncbi:MAG: hypothetical protein ACI9EF_002874 [Pseudohongiellaceae bacterium]|jgi:hypothetical protein